MVFFSYLLTHLYFLYGIHPSTHRHRNLPCCPLERGSDAFPYGMGLGYDSTTDDYKVVLILMVPLAEFEVWVFGLKSNSWRRVWTDFLPRRTMLLSTGYFAHGDLHWACKLDADDKDVLSWDLVAFDVAKEMFSLLTQPRYPHEGIRALYILDGCLCIHSLSNGEVVLYVRKKDGADFTWSIVYSVTIAQLSPFLEFEHFRSVTVFGYSNEGAKIMLDLGSQCMITYDLKEKSFQTTTITSRTNEIRFARPCFESLVSVRR